MASQHSDRVPSDWGCVPWPEEAVEGYRRAGLWRGETLGEVLRARAAAHPDRPALVDASVRWTYGELDARADALAGGLASLGIRHGDRVLVQLPNVVEILAVYFALFRLGAVPVCALPVHRRAEVRALCEIAGTAAYITCERHLGFEHRALAAEVQNELGCLRHVIVAGEPLPGQTALEALLDRGPSTLAPPRSSDLALLQLSGGTTGTPKLIPRTHDDYLCAGRACLEHAGFGPDDAYMAALPVPHNFPLVSPGCLGALMCGGRVVLAPAPSPDVCLALIESEGVTHTSVVPPVALLWLGAAPRAGRNLSSLRVLQVGGAKCSAEVAARVRLVLGATLQQVFGMAEGLINMTRLDDPEDVIVATQGRPASAHDEIRIVDDQDREVEPGQSGQLLTRGPYTVRGYYRAAEHNAIAFTREGWYRTGDVVRLRPDGNLVVEGRTKDQINRGGEKIAPEEIENHLLAHPAVHDAAVVAMPDALLGERACAFVVPRPGEDPRARELTTFLRARQLAAHKIPDRVEVVADFPVSGIGKVSKAALRAAIAATFFTSDLPDPKGPAT